ncbi:succinate semialdehyde dehydrogenase NADP+ linked [Ceratobasidium sp. 414]|nr:succinate semialdehyde dehydrogenase NADP+ linked [Ceratobasidium sp. 414]
MPPSYPASSPPQLQLLSRYVGAFSADPGLSGLVLRTYFSSLTGVAWTPGDSAVFDGVEHARERATTWYQGKLSEKTAGELQREIDRESHTTEPVREIEKGIPKELAEPVELPTGIEFTIAEPITDRKSVFIGRACRITHHEQVPIILAYLMADKRIARAAHPIINAWRCTVDEISHQDNDDDGESAAGRGLAHLLQIMDVDNVLVVVTRFFGGIHLGPDRFKWINQSARNALEQGGFLEQANTTATGRKGKRRTPPHPSGSKGPLCASTPSSATMLRFARAPSILKSPATSRVVRAGTTPLRLNFALHSSRMASSLTTNFSGVKDQSLIKNQAFIAGQWVDAKDGGKIKVTNPATDEVLGTVPELGVEDTKRAIQHAAEAFKTWSKTTAKERHDILRKLYQLMMDNNDDLGLIITLENGKPLAEGKGENAYSASFVEAFTEVIPSSMLSVRNVVVKQPVGVAALLTPWNFPSAMIGRKLAPALAAGCTVVIKPPAETPFSALALAELARRAGVPDGVINVVTTDKNIKEVGRELCESKDVKKVSFTGSTPVAKILSQQASSTLKKVSWEAGGNAPFIVFDDADIEKAVEGAIACKFRGSGQTCVCANRIYVQSSVYADFAAQLAEKVDAFKLGNGMDPKTFETEDEVIRLANNSDVGLAGYFFSRDVGRVWRVAEALEVGMVGTNTGMISQAQVPFGGIKESGLGREGGPHGIDEYMNTKLVVFGGL